MTSSGNPQLRGAALGLLAALLFGASAPVSKVLLNDVSPLVLAGLLYLGAALGVWGYRLATPKTAEAPLQKSDVPSLVVVAVSGGLVAPVLMLYGLTRVTAFTGSLLLNLEAPLTVVFAVWFFREHLGHRGLFAVAAISAGAALLSAAPRSSSATEASTGSPLHGGLMIAVACACWALDNNLTQRLSVRDPFAVVRVKTLIAGIGNTALGLAVSGWHLPNITLTLGALALGSVSYGASVLLDAYALRYNGAARQAAYFATAPFIGAVTSLIVFQALPQVQELGALALMVLGVLALLCEKHSHEHTHETMTHEHLHVHDEHHRHAHAPGAPTTEPHSHIHTHEPLSHDHPHLPDVHHRHRH